MSEWWVEGGEYEGFNISLLSVWPLNEQRAHHVVWPRCFSTSTEALCQLTTHNIGQVCRSVGG